MHLTFFFAASSLLCAYGAPVYSDIVERSEPLALGEVLVERNAVSFLDLEHRTGPFSTLSQNQKQDAMNLVNSATKSQIAEAITPGDSAKTVNDRDSANFHLDRQQAGTSSGTVKAAVQKKTGDKGTVGQIEVFPDTRIKAYDEIMAKTKGVSAQQKKKAEDEKKKVENSLVKTAKGALKHSIKTGKEVSINRPGSTRKQINIEANEKARKAKEQRIAKGTNTKAQKKTDRVNIAKEKTDALNKIGQKDKSGKKQKSQAKIDKSKAKKDAKKTKKQERKGRVGLQGK